MSELRYNYQLIVLDTDEGTAVDKEQLLEVWKRRIQEIAPHYRVTSVLIKKGAGKER